MSEGIVRIATIADAQRIAEIRVKAWQHAYKGHMPEDYLQNLSIERRKEQWVQTLSDLGSKKRVFVVENKGTIVGYCMAGPSRDEDSSDQTGDIYAIYIDPGFMRKGYGSQLLDKAVNFLKQEGYNRATLWVLSSYDPARRFYEKHGWYAEDKVKVDHREDFELHETRYRKDLV